MPKVSVIIPTHNRAETLSSALGSVLNQTFQDFEILVVDDASQDHTRQVVDRFADSRIKYIRHPDSKGEGGARNTGLKNANGHFIAFLDDDDEWLPRKLELQVSLLESRPLKVGAVYTGFCKIDKANTKQLVQTIPTKSGNIFNDILTENWISSSTLLVRKECFEKVGNFEEGMTYGADYDMWLRVAKEFDFDCIKEPLATYYIHGDNVTSSYETVIKGLEFQLRRYGLLWALNRKGCSQRYHSLGVLYCYTGDIGKGREALLRAITLYPLKIQYYYNFFLSFLGVGAFRKVSDIKEKIIFKICESYHSWYRSEEP